MGLWPKIHRTILDELGRRALLDRSRRRSSRRASMGSGSGQQKAKRWFRASNKPGTRHGRDDGDRRFDRHLGVVLDGLAARLRR
ncbi:hypothetical protein HNR06_002796 [Nocardiopsis arvandica]|uniref:Uncharacterized protein n=1 Tax=Nocardiopsis sinuspersici TaxID=501010 RepID=A0A7Z0BL56_9ACTN|nr:hypothetical protein [Nocardiopsis sinuspersici]